MIFDHVYSRQEASIFQYGCFNVVLKLFVFVLCQIEWLVRLANYKSHSTNDEKQQ